MSRLFSKPPKAPAHPVPQEPPQHPTIPVPNWSHQMLNHRHGKTVKPGPLERHAVKRSPVDDTSISSPPSRDACNNHTPRTLWDTRDTFLPVAKPPPPLPKVEKPKRALSQRHAKSPKGAAISPPLSTTHVWGYQELCATSTKRTLYDLPKSDVSLEPPKEVDPKVRGSLRRSNTLVTASSGTSEESASKWRILPSWTRPSADADKESRPRAKSLSRFGSRKRAQSNPKNNDRDDYPPKHITLELLDVAKPGGRTRAGTVPRER